MTVVCLHWHLPLYYYACLANVYIMLRGGQYNLGYSVWVGGTVSPRGEGGGHYMLGYIVPQGLGYIVQEKGGQWIL